MSLKLKGNSAKGSGGTEYVTASANRDEAANSARLKAHEQMRNNMLGMDAAYYQAQSRLSEQMTERQIETVEKLTASVGGLMKNMAAQTTEMVGYMLGQMMAGAELSGKNMAAGFMDLFAQMMVAMGSAMLAASAAFSALFSLNPVGMLAGGLAMIAAGGIIKGLVAELRSNAGGSLGSGSGMYGQVPLGGGTATGSPSLTPLSTSDGNGTQTTVINFYGDYMDPQKLARKVSSAIGKHAGKSVPRIPSSAVAG